jgi:hypothetical protein
MNATRDEWKALQAALRRWFNEKRMYKAEIEIGMMTPVDVGIVLSEEKPEPQKPAKLGLQKRNWSGSLTK